jgi:hypothetical protein
MVRTTIFDQNNCVIVSDVNNCANIFFDTVAANNNQYSVSTTFTMLHFSNTVNAKLSQCSVNNNISLIADVCGYGINNGNGFVLNDCICNNNGTAGSQALVTCFSLSGTQLIANRCIGEKNNANSSGSRLYCFFCSPSSVDIILNKCVVHSNQADTQVVGFLIDGLLHSLFECIAKNNISPGTTVGFSYRSTSSAVTTELSIAKSNSGGSSTTGFLNSNNENVFFDNIAQANTNFSTNYSGVFLTVNFTPTVGFSVTPNPFNNINITLP